MMRFRNGEAGEAAGAFQDSVFIENVKICLTQFECLGKEFEGLQAQLPKFAFAANQAVQAGQPGKKS